MEPAVATNPRRLSISPLGTRAELLDWRRALTRGLGAATVLAYVAAGLALLLSTDSQSGSAAYALALWLSFMLRTFAFHLGVGLLGLSLLAVVIRQRVLAALLLPPALLGLAPLIVAASRPAAPACPAEALRVVSANVFREARSPAQIIAELLASDADVILLQEYTPRWHRIALAALAERYPHVCTLPRNDSYGLALYSRLPLLEPADFNLPIGSPPLPQARFVLDWQGRSIALYNIHLRSPSSLAAIAAQRREAADLAQLLAREPLPAVACGDFNFTNESPYAAALRRAGLTDAHEIAGTGLGDTWPVLSLLRYVPGIRLDHIFLTHHWSACESHTGVGRGSDHRPVSARIFLKD